MAVSDKDKAALEAFKSGKVLKNIELISGAVKLTFEDGATLEFDAVGPAGSKLQLAYSLKMSGKLEV